eukprot:scaffold95230_cov22-Tisochrysis_lutea.AAC.2
MGGCTGGRSAHLARTAQTMHTHQMLGSPGAMSSPCSSSGYGWLRLRPLAVAWGPAGFNPREGVRHWGTAAGDVQPQRHANKLQLVDILGIIVIIIIAGGGG